LVSLRKISTVTSTRLSTNHDGNLGLPNKIKIHRLKTITILL
jgi:hypothetical protein